MMPISAKTPASRRFLPASHSSHSQTQSAPGHKQSFVKPYQSGSSSPFVRTPFQRSTVRDDDIEATNDDDRAFTWSELPSTRSRPARHGSIDLIEDTDGYTHSPERRLLQLADPDTLDEVGQAPSSREPIRNVDVVDHFSSPLPKRQKRVHVPEPSQHNDAESPPPSGSDVDDDEQDAASRQMLNDMLDSEKLSSEISSQIGGRPRFRNPVPVNPPSPDKLVRPGFRSFFQGATGIGNSLLDTPLPETFSPSRRKGKKEYMYDGAAETVRRWVLDIANEESQRTNTKQQVVDLTYVETDPSGRFEIHRDKEGHTWMMVRQQGLSNTASSLRSNTRNHETTIRLHGTATQWSLDIERDAAVKVAVLWEPVK